MARVCAASYEQQAAHPQRWNAKHGKLNCRHAADTVWNITLDTIKFRWRADQSPSVQGHPQVLDHGWHQRNQRKHQRFNANIPKPNGNQKHNLLIHLIAIYRSYLLSSDAVLKTMQDQFRVSHSSHRELECVDLVTMRNRTLTLSLYSLHLRWLILT